jgi:long-chain acyl-CoA synthetase
VRALREGQVTAIIGVPRLYRALLAGLQSRSESAGRLTSALFRGGLGLSTALAQRRIRIGRWLFRRVHREIGPQLRIMATGGAAIEPELAWKLEGLGWLVCTGYGLTETSPLLTFDKPGQARIGSVGRPVSGIDVRIDPVLDRNGDQQETKARSDQRSSDTTAASDPAASGEVGEAEEARADSTSTDSPEGEVVARGPSVFAGYHNLPDQTQEAFTDDGWFRTGDLGYFDRDGYLFITGRVKTLIVLEGGEKIQPDDLEENFHGNPAIREIGVLEREGKLVAVIRPVNRNGNQQQPQNGEDADVRTALEERSRSLPSYQRIAEFVLTSADLPRTRLGKIRREELKELYEKIKAGKGAPAETGPIPEEEMTPEDRALLDEPTARQAWEWLARRFADRRLTPDASPQLDLGIDSLEWLNLTMEIRQSCGVELSQEAIGRIETVRDLLREVAEQPQAQGAAPAIDPLENPDAVIRDERERWLSPLGPVESAAAWLLYALNWMLVHLVFRLRVEGRERLPEKGPFVLSPHHVSLLDSCVLAAALDFKRLRETYWAGWTGIAFGPVFRYLRRLARVVPIDPEKAAASSLAFGAAVLKGKHNMVWYPEGGLSKTGEVEPLKPGIGLLLEHYPVPVVPAFEQGTREALPPGRLLPRPGHVRVVFGAPLDPRELEQRGKGDTPHERITSALHDELARLCRN